MYDLALASALALQTFKKVLIIAPHQDDESLGCGGCINKMTKIGIEVYVVFITDGSMSHPNSLKFPKNKLIKTREKEAINALKILGVPEKNIFFLGFQDSQLSLEGSNNFINAKKKLTEVFEKIIPNEVFLPWKRDPHRDHIATWQISNEVILLLKKKPRVLQYFIWLLERGNKKDLPKEHEVRWWKVDIKNELQVKQTAIKAHVSQVTNLIDDDSSGFILSPEVLKHFNSHFELFAETIQTIL